MAKATAICTCATCGAEFEKIAFKRNRTEANEWEAWAVANIDECPDCYRARLAAERDAENRAAMEDAKATGLPSLTGSDKQIAWATTIDDLRRVGG